MRFRNIERKKPIRTSFYNYALKFRILRNQRGSLIMLDHIPACDIDYACIYDPT